MELLKAAPEQLASFVTFIIVFAKSPRTALAPYATPNADSRATVSSQLILFCALSVGCAALIFTVAEAIGMAEDRSSSVAIVRRIDPKLLPLVVALGIIALSGLWHGLTRLVSIVIARLDPGLRFDGKVENSINAGLAFATLYLVVMSVVLAAVRVAAAHTSLPWFVYLLALIPLGIAFLVYFILSFATLHRVEPGRYFVLIGLTVVAIQLLTGWLGKANG